MNGLYGVVDDFADFYFGVELDFDEMHVGTSGVQVLLGEREVSLGQGYLRRPQDQD